MRQAQDISPSETMSFQDIQETGHDENFDEDNSDFNEDDNDFDDELDSLSSPIIDYTKADPLEKMNKVFYGLHRGLDLLFVRPLALTYSKVLPKPVQTSVSNFVTNLTAPLRFLCRLLQGNLEEAGKTAGKFVTNTVLGLGGIFDVAKKMNLKETPTNFSETLKKWGVSPGPYIVIPGVGPSTLRGALGFLFDSFLDPVFLWTLNKDLPGNKRHELMWGDTGIQLTSLLISRSNIDPIYEDVESNSINRYSKLRTLVLQQSINR